MTSTTQPDTMESQAARVAAIKDAGHRREERRHLGYVSVWCAKCCCHWPCPDFAAAAEWRQ